MKTLSYSNANYTQSPINRTWKFWFCSFSISLFFLSFFLSFLLSFAPTHHSETVQHIQMICTPITLKSFLFWVRATSELRLASYGFKHASWSHLMQCFVRNCMHNSRTKGCIEMFCLSMTDLLLKISLLWVRAGCKTQSARYLSKHFVCPFMHNSKNASYIWLSVLHV